MSGAQIFASQNWHASRGTRKSSITVSIIATRKERYRKGSVFERPISTGSRFLLKTTCLISLSLHTSLSIFHVPSIFSGNVYASASRGESCTSRPLRSDPCYFRACRSNTRSFSAFHSMTIRPMHPALGHPNHCIDWQDISLAILWRQDILSVRGESDGSFHYTFFTLGRNEAENFWKAILGQLWAGPHSSWYASQRR